VSFSQHAYIFYQQPHNWPIRCRSRARAAAADNIRQHLDIKLLGIKELIPDPNKIHPGQKIKIPLD
jgi:hypothetical protein